MSENPQYNRETCYFCHDADTHLHETHHIVPRRYDGSDKQANLVHVCPTCHRKLETLYDERFFAALDVETPDSDGDVSEESEVVACTSTEADEHSQTVLDIVEELQSESVYGAPVGEVMAGAKEIGIDASTFSDAVEQLKQKGEIYQPQKGRLRTT